MFGSTQLVKRQRSEADLNGNALAKINGSGNNTLVKGVSLIPKGCSFARSELKQEHEGRNN